MAACIFCKIIRGDIPSFKLFESERILAFLDIQPLSKGHAASQVYGCGLQSVPVLTGMQLVIPKYHGAKLTEIPDDQLQEVLPVVKKLVTATGAEDYNILQNNGRLAHQEVDHVHFHMIPKPNEKEGLGIGWPATAPEKDKLKELYEHIKSKM